MFDPLNISESMEVNPKNLEFFLRIAIAHSIGPIPGIEVTQVSDRGVAFTVFGESFFVALAVSKV